MDSILRVANRALYAGFIPDKFWKAKIAELKAILAKPIASPEEADLAFIDEVLPFYRKLEADLIEHGVHDWAKRSIQDRVVTMMDIVVKMMSLHQKFHTETYKTYTESPKSETISYLQQAIRSAYSEKIKTVGHAFKNTWSVDSGKIEDLARRLLKKASQEQIDAMWEVARGNYSNGPLSRKYEFLTSVGAEAAALRLIRKDKVTWDPFKSLQMMRDVLESNYSENALSSHTEFDLHGMKIIVDDDSLQPDDINKYVGLLKESYAKLKAKGFGKVWYGVTFISCQSCGGVNDNTGGGVGGHFNIHKDWVKIFVRPTPFVVELMVHELGHRHWFKGMSSDQRAKFHSLVRTHEGQNPEKIQAAKRVPLEVMKNRRDELSVTCTEALDRFHRLEVEAEKRLGVNPLTKEDLLAWKRVIRVTEDDLSKLYGVTSNMVERGGSLKQTREGLKMSTEFNMLLMELTGSLTEKFDEVMKSYEPTEAIEFYTGYAKTQVQKLKDLGFDLLLKLTQEHNQLALEEAENLAKEVQEKWEKDERSVLPVSSYGSSNIDEAFAEVFMKYVLGQDMNRDQVDSFKSVLSSMSDLYDLASLNLVPHQR